MFGGSGGDGGEEGVRGEFGLLQGVPPLYQSTGYGSAVSPVRQRGGPFEGLPYAPVGVNMLTP